MALLATLVKTAWYSLLLSVALGVKVSVGVVAPVMSAKVTPPSVLTCHCTVGVGVPLAAAVKVTGVPAVMVWLVGSVVTTGATAAVTVSVAGALVTLPALFVKTASYSLPVSVALVVKVSVGEVAPVMSAKVTPPSVLTCHCTVGVGVPLAAAVKVTGVPAVMVWLVGSVVTTGATAAVTVSVAGALVTLPALFVKTASYSLPVSVALVVKVSVGEVAPVMSAKVTPPSVLTCHCTVGVGVPLAAAVKVTGVPAVMVWLVGSVVTTGATAAVTVRVAAALVALLATLVKTAWYSLSLSVALGVKVSVGVVALALPVMSVKVVPPSVLTCHCTVGVGVPLAAAVKVTGVPAVIVWLVGSVVTTGATAAVTVSVAGALVMLPALFVKTASYSLPVSVALVVKVSVGEVAPVMSAKVTPPSVLTCHCTVGVGVPLAAAVKVTGVPAVMVWLVRSVVTTGATAAVTVRVAAALVALPATLVKTAWYSLLLSVALVVKVSVGEVAPVMSAKVTPPSVLTCHCTVGVGVPLAAAVKVTAFAGGDRLTARVGGDDRSQATLTVRWPDWLVVLPAGW